MDRRTFLLAFGGTALSLALPEAAEAAQWVRLGTSCVNGLVDTDRIVVGRRMGTFRRLRLRVRGNSLLIHDVRVRYANGRDDRLNVRNLIRQGGHTRAIDLRGDHRLIRDVTFTYGKLPNGRGPTFVDLFGMR